MQLITEMKMKNVISNLKDNLKMLFQNAKEGI